MIFTERTITVVNNSATINKPLILYRGDKNIELKITIAESQFKFRNTDASNVIETTDASYAQLVINTPYGLPIFSDVAATKNGAVIFVITEAMIDEIREVGAYEIQIRLLDDNKQSRASIPPVSNAIEIREPIAIEDGSAVDSNAVNVAKVNRALTTTSAPLEAFDSQGNYIKNNWGDGDPITDAALNKMEAGIDGVNKKIGNVNSQFNEKADKDDLEVERKRIDSFIKLEEGSTTGDAELIDARIGLGGVVYNNVGEAIRKPMTEIIDVYKSLNLLNPKNCKIGTSLESSNGQEVSSSATSVTDYIPISNTIYGIYIYQYNKIMNPNCNIWFYDSTKNFISKISSSANSTGSGRINNIPENAKYMRFTFVSSDGGIFNIAMVIEGDTAPTKYIPYSIDYKIKDDSLSENIVRKSNIDILQSEINSLMPQYDITDYMLFCETYENMLIKDDGTLVADRDNKRNATSMVKIDKTKNMYSNTKGAALVFFYDINKIFISKSAIYKGTPINTYPENAEYVAFYYFKDSVIGDTFHVSTKDTADMPYFASNIKKIKGTRPRIDIYTTDSEETIYRKLWEAFYTEDCDVYFEYGNYEFNEIWSIMKNSYKKRIYLELPIGGNCRYYFNNSNISATYDDVSSGDTVCLFSTVAKAESYELHDGFLTGNDIVYVLHDEGSGSTNKYMHKCKNIHIKYNTTNQTNNIRKCVGGGTGIYGISIYENCTFETDAGVDVSFHGISSSMQDVAHFNLVVSNCYFSNKLSLDALGPNQTALLIYNGNSSLNSVANNSNWKIKSWCNEIRNS